MKKIYLIFALGLLSLFNVTFADTVCDQVFENVYVRYGSYYRFYDTYTNPGTTPHYINEVTTGYVNPDYLNQGGQFDLTQELRNSNFTVNGGQTMEVLSTTPPGWQIVKHPQTRTNATAGSYDFMISYKSNYDFSNNYPDASDDRFHTECQYYSVTWCGDGVKDAEEVCDPNDSTKTGWGVGGCDATCQPVTTPVSCISGGITGLQATPISGTTPGLCEPGKTVGSFVANTSGNSTSYSWTCDGVGGGNCSANYNTSTPPTDSCISGGVTGLQASPISDSTSGLCEPGRTVGSFVANTSGNSTSYSWTCDGNGGGNCNAYYTFTTPPTDSCISGGVTGSQSSTISSSTPGLCEPGKTVGSFTASDNGSSINYSWTCDSNGGGNCNAYYSYGGPVCNAIVTGQQPSPINDTTVGLCYPGETVGSFTATTSGNSTNYSWTCNGLSGGNCSAIYTTGGGGPSCTSLSVNGAQPSPVSASTPGLCYPGEVVTSFTSTTSGNVTSYSWACNGNGGGSCNATYTTGGGGGPGGGGPGGGGNYCGDGILQRPNNQGIYEECDFGNGTWPAWCQRSTCSIIESTTPNGLTNSNSTIPNGGTINMYPIGNLLIGHGMSVFGSISPSEVYIQNTSPSEIYVNKPLCIYKENTSYSVLNGISSYCSSDVVGYLGRNGGKKSMPFSTSSFIGDVDSLPNGVDYGDAKITTTLYGLRSMDTFLKSTLNVRVAKPSVVTVGGGASLLNGAKYSDINNVSQGTALLLRPEINKNLILSSLGVNPLSSYVKSSSDSNIIVKGKAEGNKDLEKFSTFDSNLSNQSINNLPTDKFNGFDDVFIHKGNVNLNSQTISGGNKTFIVEDGDLNINGDISSSDSILFVVKNGDINIKNSVKNIDAIIINIGGKVNGEADYTLNRLTINGAIYGKLDDLLSKRTYIKDRGEYVDVGTVVNFTSKIFTSPPPLLSKFLGEYTNLQKVPK